MSGMSWIDFMRDFAPRLLEEGGPLWSIYRLAVAAALVLYTVRPLLCTILAVMLIRAVRDRKRN